MIRSKSHFWQKILIASAITIFVIIIFSIIPVFHSFELKILDYLVSLKGERYANKDVVLILADDETNEHMFFHYQEPFMPN